jgi:hypothetical protein
LGWLMEKIKFIRNPLISLQIRSKSTDLSMTPRYDT